MKENNENDLISRQALYDKCVELEQEALKMVQTADDKIEKLIWNAVLTERSAFKFSVVDAPASLSNLSAEPKRKKGYWTEDSDPGQIIGEHYSCSECRACFGTLKSNFCPNCGSEMTRGDYE